jgi:hypothetical protein
VAPCHKGRIAPKWMPPLLKLGTIEDRRRLLHLPLGIFHPLLAPIAKAPA